MSTFAVLGTGVTGQAIARALRRHDHDVVVLDDRPDDDARRFAADIGAPFVGAPDAAALRSALTGVDALLPSPGVPDAHPIFSIAAEIGVAVRSEFDLARMWDDRPLAVITGTNGKTTVTMMVTAMLEASGLHAAAVGNTETPLVAALPDTSVDVFVVEASSFRLGHTDRLRCSAATWLNFAPDHLDVHASLDAYEAAKASIWADLDDPAVAIAVIDDAVVRTHAPSGATTVGAGGDWYSDGEQLHGPDGPFLAVRELPRSLPHDQVNALAAAATALRVGATFDGVRAVLRSFEGLAHRVEHVGTHCGVAYYNDSKATAPHAVLAALGGFDDVVLIAGGKNKGLDLGELRAGSSAVRAVVAIGDSADEIVAAFDGAAPTVVADSMRSAVEQATNLASNAVLLSPGCASFDWYENYQARGDAFRECVHQLAELHPCSSVPNEETR